MSAFPKLQFDTRTKKPKLFLLLLLAGIAGLAVLLLSLGGTERSAVPICGITAAFCLAAFFMLLWAWREQLRYCLFHCLLPQPEPQPVQKQQESM